MADHISRIRVGIFFGGRSREREISFAGGRTVYDNLDKTLFEPVPVFVDSLGGFTELDWPWLYKGTIRDFFPGSSVNDGRNPWQVYMDSLEDESPEFHEKLRSAVGKPLEPTGLAARMDVAFLCLHGPYGEDGSIQGLLDWLGIPYTGSGLFASAFGIDKSIQRNLLRPPAFDSPRFTMVSRAWLEDWRREKMEALRERIRRDVGFPCVVKAPLQGSSIGVVILRDDSPEVLQAALQQAFFFQPVYRSRWSQMAAEDRQAWINGFLDVRSGPGLPVSVYRSPGDAFPLSRCNGPADLFSVLDEPGWESLWLEAADAGQQVLVESFIEGKEFSCIVVEDEQGRPIALPPTEIRKTSDIFDYRAKYLPGISRKITPIEIPEAHLENIREACERMYRTFGFEVYARLDGFVTDSGEVILNDPNTTSGMLPSSFFFHQSAEIGLNPSQFLTFILERSLNARLRSGKNRYAIQGLLQRLSQLGEIRSENQKARTRVAVIMGGYSTERHISLESGRNIYEKLASSAAYEPVPVFLTGGPGNWSLYELPVKYLLKDNADDVAQLVTQPKPLHPYVQDVIRRASAITNRFAGKALFESRKTELSGLPGLVDCVFIALHGRPGEDGSLQAELEKLGLPYNGSGPGSSRITINKFETNRILRENGIAVAGHRMAEKSRWLANPLAWQEEIERVFPYPFIAKPADDGCSSAVKKIKSAAELQAFATLMFRNAPEKPEGPSQVLGLRPSEEFPMKDAFLIETLIDKGEAVHFLEITGGMLTRINEKGERVYEVFEPSETLASGEVLSLEEKFLAGEGQNITPARFSKDPAMQARISAEVRGVLEKTARILDVEGYCRIDAFVRVYAGGKVETVVIEINSLPGMTPATCIFHQAALSKHKPLEFIDAILQYGQIRSREMA
jgi:UDP-N-acetylmuramate--alanine ligase